MITWKSEPGSDSVEGGGEVVAVARQPLNLFYEEKPKKKLIKDLFQI